MDIQKIKDRTEVDANGCWVWIKSVSSSGYGQLTVDKKYWSAHKYAYTCANGDVEKGLVIRHKCHNTRCCNPEHLISGTNKDNYHDSINAHNKANSKKAFLWVVGDNAYSSAREAVKKTGISTGALIRHSKKGKFDISSYREACKISNANPKI